MPNKGRSERMAHTRIVLYVFGDAPNSINARRTLGAFLDSPLAEDCLEVEIVDLMIDTERAARDRVFVTPYLVVRDGMRVVRLAGELPGAAELAKIVRPAGAEDKNGERQ